jgi:F-box/leucine-rich repeat protein 2/20
LFVAYQPRASNIFFCRKLSDQISTASSQTNMLSITNFSVSGLPSVSRDRKEKGTPVMSAPPSGGGGGGGGAALINEVLTDDELRTVLTRLGPEAERDAFGLVCRRWLRIQSSERRRLRARAGPDMLRRLATRFPGVLDLDLSQNPSRSFYPGVINDDLDVIAGSFRSLRVLALQNCKGAAISSSAATHMCFLSI